MKATRKLQILALANLLISVAAQSRLDPLVTTDVGLIRGIRSEDDNYSMFLGIPYAFLGVGAPFGSSTPYPAFEELFEANDDSVVCPQMNTVTGEIIGVIDCLRLNVFVPDSANSQHQLPVLVWIHGGGFKDSSGSTAEFNPKYLVKHEVIVVTINYRLGPYGFLCVDIPEVSSSAGLKDQRLALRWVKQNIEQFGGNSNSITIMGESAGSMSIDYHLRYSARENIFHQAIMQSGTTQVYAGETQKEGSSYPINFAKKLGVVTDDPRVAISFLAAADPELVIAAFIDSTPSSSLVLIPCDETDFHNSDKFIDEKFSFEIPMIKNLPILIGFNNEESLITVSNTNIEDYKNSNGVKQKLNAIFNFNDSEMEAMAEKVSHFYWGDENISENIKQQLVNFNSDITFAYPITRDIQNYLDNDAKLYHYMFSYNGSRNADKVRYNVVEGGASHFDEIGYLFDRFDVPEPTEKDQLIIDRITALWTNFVKYGDPTPEVSDLLPVKWEQITRDKFNYLNIDSELTLGQRPYHDRFAFWDVFFELNKKKHKFSAEE